MTLLFSLTSLAQVVEIPGDSIEREYDYMIIDDDTKMIISS